jgi:hypothetical protein
MVFETEGKVRPWLESSPMTQKGLARWQLGMVVTMVRT